MLRLRKLLSFAAGDLNPEHVSRARAHALATLIAHEGCVHSSAASSLQRTWVCVARLTTLCAVQLFLHMCEANVQPVLLDTAALISNLAVDGKWVLSEKLFHYIFRAQPGLQPPPPLEQPDLLGLTASDLNAAYMLDCALQPSLTGTTTAGGAPLPATPHGGGGNGGYGGSQPPLGQEEYDRAGTLPPGGQGQFQGLRTGSAALFSANGRASGSLASLTSGQDESGHGAHLLRGPLLQSNHDGSGSQPLGHRSSVGLGGGDESSGRSSGMPQAWHGHRAPMAHAGSTPFASTGLPHSADDLANSLLGLSVGGSDAGHMAHKQAHARPAYEQSVPRGYGGDGGQQGAAAGELQCCNELLGIYSSLGKTERAAQLVQRMLECASPAPACSH